MSQLFFWSGWIALAVGIIIAIAIYLKAPEDGRRSYEKMAGISGPQISKEHTWLPIILGSILCILLFMVSAATREYTAREAANEALQTYYHTDKVNLGESVCATTARYLCETWEAKYEGPAGETGIIKFDLDDAIITPDK